MCYNMQRKMSPAHSELRLLGEWIMENMINIVSAIMQTIIAVIGIMGKKVERTNHGDRI